MVSAPPFFILSYFSTSAFATNMKNLWPSLAEYLDVAPLPFMLIAASWSSVAVKMIEWAQDVARPAPEGWEDVPKNLLGSLNAVVGAKAKRFSDAVRDFIDQYEAGDSISGSHAFLAITQPQLQVDALASAIHSTFSHALVDRGPTEATVGVSIFLIKNLKVQQVLVHVPNGSASPPNLQALSHAESGLMTAWRFKKIHVVQSTLDALETKKGYVVTRLSDRSRDRSLICYPVEIEATDLGLIISVSASERFAFNTKFEEKYETILEHFACRLRLEMNLVTLRRMVLESEKTKEP